MVAVRGYCTIRVAEWRNSSSYIKHSLRLLPRSQPLLSLTSMDAQQVKGGKQRRDAWAERRRNRSQPRLHTHSMEDNNISRPASAGIATTPVATSPFPQALPASPSQLASAPLTVSPQPAPPPRKRAKTYSEAIRASSRDVVWAKKRQIPQIDSCCSPPSPPLPSPPSQRATESVAKPPAVGDITSTLGAAGAHATAGFIAAKGAITARDRSRHTCACDSSRPACRALYFALPRLYSRHDMVSQL
jgi:hypothetical protein